MKFKYSLIDLDVDFYTISAHKIYGPKGIGGLYIKKGLKVKPLVFGGGQENGLRSGTENVFGIVAFRLCVDRLLKEIDENYNKVLKMKASLLNELKILNIYYRIHGENCIPHTLNISLSAKVRGETLVHALENRGVFVSTGSACSANKHYNATLESMEINKNEILSTVRISFSPYMYFDGKEIANIIKEELNKLEGRSYE